MLSDFNMKSYETRSEQPAVSIYLLSDDARILQKLSCMFCKNTLCSIKGQVDKVISTPMPTGDFDQAIEIMCKKCKQMWRLCIVANVQVVISDEAEQR